MRYFHLFCNFHKVLSNALQLLKVVILKVDLDVHIKSPFLALQHIAQFCVGWGGPTNPSRIRYGPHRPSDSQVKASDLLLVQIYSSWRYLPEMQKSFL